MKAMQCPEGIIELLPEIMQQPPAEDPVSVVIPCKGRLSHLKQILPVMLQQETQYNVEFVIVDYDDPDRCGDWAESLDCEKIRVVRAQNKPLFHLSHARNVGCRKAKGQLIIVADADCLIQPHLFDVVFGMLDWGYVAVQNPVEHGDKSCGRGCYGIHKRTWQRLRGYDENFYGYGYEESDLWQRAQQHGDVAPFPRGLCYTIPHTEAARVKHYPAWVAGDCKADRKYKFDKMKRTGRLVNPTGFGWPNKPNRLILHCAHHKAGYSWWNKTWTRLCQHFGMTYVVLQHNAVVKSKELSAMQESEQDESLFGWPGLWIRKQRPFADVAFTQFVTSVAGVPDICGLQMIRDPRDVVISGYFYHLWCDEPWCKTPRESLDGKTYQQHLNSLSKEEGIACEMSNGAYAAIRAMIDFEHYDDPLFYCLRYEDMIYDHERIFREAFEHLELPPGVVKKGVEIGDSLSFAKMTKRKLGQVQQQHHLRKGTPGDWKNHFSDAHKQHFKELFGDGLVTLGYEKDNEW